VEIDLSLLCALAPVSLCVPRRLVGSKEVHLSTCCVYLDLQVRPEISSVLIRVERSNKPVYSCVIFDLLYAVSLGGVV